MRLQLDLNNFSACPQYNEWLDQLHNERSGTLDILGFQPQPSLVLFTLSQDTYQASFDDFRHQREEELKDIVFGEFPSPIAHYFYRFENGYEHELQRLHFLRDTWEAIVDVLHAIAVAECRFLNIHLNDPIHFQHFLTDIVAQRLLNIERIISHAQSLNIDLQIAKIVSLSTLQIMRDLNQSRNAFSHSAAQSEAQARLWTSECYEEVIDIIDDLRGLVGIRILRHIGQVDARTLRCEVFRGHGLTRTIGSVPLTDDQIRDSQQYFFQGQILASCGQRIFSLRPLVYYREDPSGHVTKLCMFRRTRGDAPLRRIEYEVVGESANWGEDRGLFKAELDDPRALFGLPPD